MKIFKENLIKAINILISAGLIAINVIFVKDGVINKIIYGVSLVISGYEIFISFIKNLIKGEIFDEDTLMLIASIVAFILGEYIESVAVIILFSVGEILEDAATENSREKIASLGKLRSVKARLYSNNSVLEVMPESVKLGSLIEVRKGDRVPIDGILHSEKGEFDLSAITGESVINNVDIDGVVYSGAVNLGDTVIIKTTKLYSDSTVERIVSLIEGANSKKAKSQKFITEFSKIYTPIVVGLAVLIALIPTLIFNKPLNLWVYKALSFLVVSCPCALVISVPLAYYIGIGSLAKHGILIKGSNYIDELAGVKTVFLDKTGTLTSGEFSVKKIIPNNFSGDILKYVCSIEKFSNHPIANSLLKEYNGELLPVIGVKEISGRGIEGEISGKKIKVGNAKFMEKEIGFSSVSGFNVYLSIDGKFSGTIVLENKVKKSAKNIVSKLKKVGVKNVYILSGDIKENVLSVSKEISADKCYYGLFPEDKVKIIKSLTGGKGKTVFVGDGINDAPSLATSNVGIAMGGLGSEIAIVNSNVVILDDDLNKIPTLIYHAKKIRRKVLENIFFSIGVKISVLILAVIIKLPVFLSLFSDVGVMLLAVLNSFTNYKVKRGLN